MKWHGLGFSEKKQTGGIEEMEFPGVLKKENAEIKKEAELSGVFKENSRGMPKFLGLAFWLDLGISEGCHTILLSFQGWKLVFSRISKGKVKNFRAHWK